MHIPSLQRNVFTNVAARTVFVLEAKQITFVSKSRHTSAEARQFSENLWHILRNLVCRLRLRILGKVARVHGVNESRSRGRQLFAASAHEYPGEQCQNARGTEQEPHRLLLDLLSLFVFCFGCHQFFSFLRRNNPRSTDLPICKYPIGDG